MSALTFDKRELGNLEYSLQREMLATDRRGGYMSTTIVCCNTRKYHGLMVAPIDQSDQTYVLLSSLDETIVQHDQSFNLALHRFKEVYEPRGHKYITDFEYTPTPTITYRVGGAILRKELLWIHHRTQLLIRYTLVDAHSETRLRLRPFFAFRDKHTLSKANMAADGRSYPIPGGVKCRLYPEFPWLHLQIDKDSAEFIPAPDWYYNFEYQQELQRGYEGHEDLLTTGYFEMELKKGESIVFSASVEEMHSPTEIDELFATSIASRTHKIDFMSCLRHSARQFMIRRPGNRTEVIAGFPWEGVDSRQELIALPGIALTQDGLEDCINDLDMFVREMEGGMFAGAASAYNNVDTPLWFFWVLQQLEHHLSAEQIWNQYGQTMKTLLETYRHGLGDRVALHPNGLIWASEYNVPLTWMNAVVAGQAITPRSGYQVEVNALWYNAVCYTVELAARFGDKTFVKAWKALPAQTHAAFIEKFWLASDGYLADFVNNEEQSRFIRPNMVIACGLNYKMLTDEQQIDVLRTVEQHLLTPKGLRTLSPRNPLYKGTYAGSPEERDRAAMNGTVWVWPLAFYVKASFDISGAAFRPQAEEILANFDEEIQAYGIGSINEMFDADPPYTPRGSTSQAVSVGALLRIGELVDQYKPQAKVKVTKTKKSKQK
ncbi:MAG: amylo-alpha-1,6-glucosidase [Alistipes sp.]